MVAKISYVAAVSWPGRHVPVTEIISSFVGLTRDNRMLLSMSIASPFLDCHSYMYLAPFNLKSAGHKDSVEIFAYQWGGKCDDEFEISWL